jgi:hypothetical protein
MLKGKNGLPKSKSSLGLCGLLGRRDFRFSGGSRRPWNRKKRKLFERGNGILKSENSLGESGFLEKLRANRAVGFFMVKIIEEDWHLKNIGYEGRRK